MLFYWQFGAAMFQGIGNALRGFLQPSSDDFAARVFNWKQSGEAGGYYILISMAIVLALLYLCIAAMWLLVVDKLVLPLGFVPAHHQTARAPNDGHKGLAEHTRRVARWLGPRLRVTALIIPGIVIVPLLFQDPVNVLFWASYGYVKLELKYANTLPWPERLWVHKRKSLPK